MKKLKLIFIVILYYFLFTDNCMATPAFARKYNLSCQTCHLPVPRLKPYGNDFAGNGFRLSDKQATRYFVETGDSELSLIRDFPIAARFDAHATLNYADLEKADFGVPFILKLLSGGEISDKISYYFYFYLSERGELVGVEDCYLQYNDLFGIDLDIYFGQFQISDPLYKRELRLTLEDYQVYKVKPGLSQMNLAYDRGLMITYGTEFGTDIIFELVNGCGLTEADANKLFDIDVHKTFVGRISQDIGKFFRVGGFALTGKEDLINNAVNKAINDVLVYGVDASLGLIDIAELNLQYLQRYDGNLFLTGADINPSKDIATKGAMAELILTPNGDKSNLFYSALFNWIDSDFEPLNYSTGTLQIGYLLRRNIRLTAEGTYNFSDSENAFPFFSFGIVTGF